MVSILWIDLWKPHYAWLVEILEEIEAELGRRKNYRFGHRDVTPLWNCEGWRAG